MATRRPFSEPGSPDSPDEASTVPTTMASADAPPDPIIPDSPRTLPIQPIGMSASVEGESDRLCWAGPSGGAAKDVNEPPPPEQAPDLSTPEAAAKYLKANPQALWQMSKAEIIAIIAGPDMAKKYVAGEPAPAAPTTTPPPTATQPATTTV